MPFCILRCVLLVMLSEQYTDIEISNVMQVMETQGEQI